MGQAQVHLDDTSLDLSCAGQRYWYVFFVSSLLTFFGGIFIIFCWRLLSFVCYGNLWQACKRSVGRTFSFCCCLSQSSWNFWFKVKKKELLRQTTNVDATYESKIAWVTSAKDFCGELISGKIVLLICCWLYAMHKSCSILKANPQADESS